MTRKILIKINKKLFEIMNNAYAINKRNWIMENNIEFVQVTPTQQARLQIVLVIIVQLLVGLCKTQNQDCTIPKCANI